MPDSGSGTGIPVPSTCNAPTTIPDALPRSCVSLARYAKLIGYNECSLFGINNGQETDCYRIMSEFDRDNIAYYLAEALEEIERITRYPLCPTWFEDETHDFTRPVLANWHKVISGGVRATSVIVEDQAISYATEPACIGPIATTVTDPDEIKVYYPNSDREIEPSSVTIAGGFVTIYVPRCRLVNPDYFDNPGGGWDYNDLSYFTATVDVTRVYNDPSVNAELVWPHGKTGNCSCAEATQNACISVKDGETGELGILPGTYSGGSWSASGWNCYSCRPQKMRLNYYAGALSLSLTAENAIIRLAHTKMPHEPCSGCDYTAAVWGRDRAVPDVITRERANNPFGLMDGAWIAYKFAQQIRKVRMMAF